MKKGKYKLTVYSDSQDVLKQFHTSIIDGGDFCLIYDEAGEKCYYPTINWNYKNRKDLDLFVSCDFESEYND